VFPALETARERRGAVGGTRLAAFVNRYRRPRPTVLEDATALGDGVRAAFENLKR
jgi:hypothetical protein